MDRPVLLCTTILLHCTIHIKKGQKRNIFGSSVRVHFKKAHISLSLKQDENQCQLFIERSFFLNLSLTIEKIKNEHVK